jgi:CO/xanthine dehydrogenase Mo-binding subunit
MKKSPAGQPMWQILNCQKCFMQKFCALNMLTPKYWRSIPAKQKRCLGVRKVVTGQGCEILFGACIKDQPPLAVDKVRHAGEGVAAVIAETEKQAEEATKKIKVDYEPLPFVINPLDAFKEDAPIIPRSES